MPKKYEKEIKFNLDTNFEIIIKFTKIGNKKGKIIEEAFTLRDLNKNKNIATIDCCHNKPFHIHKYTKKGVKLKNSKQLKDITTRDDAIEYLDKNKDIL